MQDKTDLIKHATLKIDVIKNKVNYATVWAIGGTFQSSATVTVVTHNGKSYLMTNAHAVVGSSYLKVKFNTGSIQIAVKSVWTDPVLDIAILEGASEEAKELLKQKLIPLTFNTELQKKGTKVNAYGYPQGGQTLCFTQGHISRTEIRQIALSGLAGIQVQTSAPINPGNSGGPIVIENQGRQECIGIAMQGNNDLNNVGYFIPAMTLIQAIQNYEKHKKLNLKNYISFMTAPTLAMELQPLKNKTLREHLGLKRQPLSEELEGVLVTKVPEESCAYKKIIEGDILMKIDDYPILCDGNIKTDDLEDPILYSYLILKKNYLDTIHVLVLRKGENNELKEINIPIVLNKQLSQRVLGFKEEKPVKYHIQPSGENGGFVFIACKLSYMNSYENKPQMFFAMNSLRREINSLCEVVILHDILVSEETDGYDYFAARSGQNCVGTRVTKVNDKTVTNLFDLVTFLNEKPNEISIVTLESGRQIAISPSKDKTYENLKNKYQIPFFTSPQSLPVNKESLLREIEELGENDDNHIPSKLTKK